MSETTAPEAERCAMRAEHFRANCDLGRGHVKTAADWHEAGVTKTVSESGSTHSVETRIVEIVRWAPNEFEVPRSRDDDE